METKTLISPDNMWTLWAIMAGWAAITIYLEQKYDWAARISGAIIALLGAMVLSNLRVIPTDAPAYDSVWIYVVPLAIPMLLFKSDLRKIWRESGKLIVIFLISSMGTVIGAVLGFTLLSERIPELSKVAAMMTGSYIGGSVNFSAMASSFEVSKELSSAAVVADNLLMALYFFVLITIPTLKFFRRNYKHPYMDKMESSDVEEGKTVAASYWERKEVSLKDIAFAFATSIVIVAVSIALEGFVKTLGENLGGDLGKIISLLGNKYLFITTITMILATLFPHFLGEIRGAQEIGTFLIYIFFVVIGVPASIVVIVTKAPLLLLFCAIMVVMNMVMTFVGGKLFGFSLEEIILASNANIGGPTTAVAMAISKGWSELIGPIMMVGTLGYVLGNYFGIFIGNYLG
ncbi:MAG: DUF819 family protein [Peptostreptococcaceae bacterium]|nr:DUF819 family protein [Peptostreptococcaceae bacterium]